MDVLRSFDEGFRDGLLEALELAGLGDVDYKEAYALGRRAARYAVAPLVWARAVGECLDTRTVSYMLGITRQALAQRISRETLLGLPGQGTTYFPAWQFDPETDNVREIVPELLRLWRGAPRHVVASWATTPQPEELGELTPAAWIVAGKDPEPVLLAARRAVRALTR